jgi:hypothetical protein
MPILPFSVGVVIGGALIYWMKNSKKTKNDDKIKQDEKTKKITEETKK